MGGVAIGVSQPITKLLDALPNEQAWASQQPIFWTSNRMFAFNKEVSAVATNKAIAYKSTDGGITWSKPDAASATTSNGFMDYYFDGVSNIVNMVILAANSGTQSLILQNFDLNAEAYSATYGAATAPTQVFEGIPKILRFGDGTLIAFFQLFESGIHARCQFAIFSGGIGGSWGGVVDVAPFIALGSTFIQLEAALVDAAHNLVHYIFSAGALPSGSLYYSYVYSNGTQGPVTQLPVGSLIGGNLNQGRSFGPGILIPNVNVQNSKLIFPVLTRTAAIVSLNVATITFNQPSVNSPGASAQSGNLTSGAGWSGVDGPGGTMLPSMAVSAPVDTAAGSALGWEPAEAIIFGNAASMTVAYFMGDGAGGLYNLVKVVVNTGGGWSAPDTLYNAALDPNAGQNTTNHQWINAISADRNPDGGVSFQIATWRTLAGEPFQNTATLSTEFSSAAASPVPVPVPLTLFAASHSYIQPITLPDPKLCKTQGNVRPQFQVGFTLRGLPTYKKPAGSLPGVIKTRVQ